MRGGLQEVRPGRDGEDQLQGVQRHDEQEEVIHGSGTGHGNDHACNSRYRDRLCFHSNRTAPSQNVIPRRRETWPKSIIPLSRTIRSAFPKLRKYMSGKSQCCMLYTVKPSNCFAVSRNVHSLFFRVQLQAIFRPYEVFMCVPNFPRGEESDVG